MEISYEDVLNILTIIEQSSCEELHLEIGDFKLIVRRKSAAAPSGASHPVASVGETDPATASLLHRTGSLENEVRVPIPSEVTGTPAVEPAGQARPVEEAGAVVRAPMVGTFYRAPAPGAPPFVEIGSLVDENDIVCIIEVMKLMNSIRAGCRGRVVQILAENGALVEYGQPLIVVEPLP